MTYNELAQVLETKNPETGKLYTLNDLNVFKMSDHRHRHAPGRHLRPGRLDQDKANQATATKFLQASFKGWIYCRDHVKDCVNIVLANGPALPRGHQTWQMNEINALIWPNRLGIGIMDPAQFAITAQIALKYGVIKKKATAGAYRHEVRRRRRSQRSKKQGVDVTGKSWTSRVSSSSRKAESKRLSREGDPQCPCSSKVAASSRRPTTTRRRVRRRRADLPHRRVAGRRSGPGDRRSREVRASRLHRPAHASRHAVRRHGDDRRRRVGPDGGGVRRHDLPRRLRHPAARVDVRRRARRVAVEGGRQADHRHGLPHGGHRPEGGRLAGGARVAARPGRHLLQALHGLQGRAHGRRRDALQDDGGGRGDRRARDGARRERRRDRRAREEGAGRGAHRAALARAHAAAGDRGRGDEPRHPALARRRLSRSTSSTSRAARPWSRSSGRARKAGTSGARRARSTSSSTTRSSSGPTSRARSTSTRRRRARRRTRTCSGTPCARTCCRPSPPTTARSPGRSRRRWAATTSRRSRTAARGSRTGCR